MVWTVIYNISKENIKLYLRVFFTDNFSVLISFTGNNRDSPSERLIPGMPAPAFDIGWHVNKELQ